MSMQRTSMMRKPEVQRNWYVVDADGQIVGRLATRLATVLMGKHKPIYTPHVDCGDFVVVVNADRVRFSGRPIAHPKHPHFTDKWFQRTYERYSGYPGGRKIRTAAEMLDHKPEQIIREAVRRMLPKTKLGRQMLRKLKIYAGPDHPHQAQHPSELPEYLWCCPDPGSSA